MSGDIRYALRMLRKSPAFTVTAVTVLALAIGANTAMFSVLNAVMLRPLPYRSPEQLAILWTEIPNQHIREGRTAYWNIEQWRSQSRSFADIAFFDGVSATLTTADAAEQISVLRHSPNLLLLLGVQPELGRMFSDEEAEQRRHVALISHHFWQSRYGGSRDAIGATVEIDGVACQIIGVLPAGLPFLKADMSQPHTMYADWETLRRARGSGFWSVIGRLRPNVTLDQAQAEMSAMARHLDEQMPAAERNRGISVVPLSLQVTGRGARLALWMLAGAVFCVLLIAATNVASLSLARGASREKEMAVRAALGASRMRMVRQLLVESLTLAAIAGVLGFGVAVAGIRLILAIRPGNLVRLGEVSLDPQVMGAALAICLFTGIVVGLAPAIAAARRNGAHWVQQGGRGVAGGLASRRLRRALTVAEFALAIVLLAGAGLLVRSLWSVENVDLGFRPARVLAVSLATPVSMAPAQRADFYDRILEQAGAVPGVESAGVTSELFIGGNPERILTAEIGAGIVSDTVRFRSDEVSGALFQSLGTPLLRGRFFSAADGPDSPRVAIINDAMARRVWPGADPVGKRFKVGAADSGSPWYTVVGVVRDMRRQGLETEPIPQMFEPIAQNPSRRVILVIRTATAEPLKLAGAVRAAVRRVDKHALVYGVTTLEDRLDVFLAERRFQTSLLLSFSLVALLMAAIGIYGLIHYSVAMRTREIGIRIAVGAQAGAIFRMILGEGLKVSVTGLAIGLGGAYWVTAAGSSLLFGVAAGDPVTFGAASALLIVVAAAACYFPARRAMKIEPIIALREE